MVLDDGSQLVIPRPRLERIIAAGLGCGLADVARLLAGDQYDALMSVIATDGVGLLKSLVDAMAEHFGVREAARAARLIDRYGSAIRADLRRYYGVDMLDFFRGVLSAPAVLDYLEHLPRTSAYHAAVAGDEEVADALAQRAEQAPKKPSTTEFSPEMQALATISDQLQVIANILVAANGGKATAIKPYPRPITAVQKAKERRRYDQHRSLVSRVLPDS